MPEIKQLLSDNKKWAHKIKKEDPDFFKKLNEQQKPEYLWIGCSDSRVPANQIIGLMPGEVFVHRNIANLVIQTDLNCLSVIQFAIEILNIKHIIVCGHYDCGGVKAAMSAKEYGLMDNWVLNIKNLYRYHQPKVEALQSTNEKQNLMCELNVAEQVANVCHTTVVKKAWKNNQKVKVHGWIYSIDDGIIKDLGVSTSSEEEIPEIYNNALFKS